MEGKSKYFVIVLVILLGVVLSLIFYLQLTSQNDRKFSVSFFDIGQGDSALIKFDNGQKMLVDCGPDRKILSKLGSALPFFDRTIDYLLVTHPDGDHYGGCPAVLQRYQVKNIITNGAQKSGDPYWLAWVKYSKLEQSNNKIINGSEELDIGQEKINFLAPDDNLTVDQNVSGGNNHSIVFLLKSPVGRFLFTGDMEMPLEDAIIDKYCVSSTPCSALKADYLKVGHHGSNSSSGQNFLALVSPKYAVVSVGPNKYGHPSLRVLRKLERAGAQIWRTDEQSDIIVK